jgi:cytochrome c5
MKKLILCLILLTSSLACSTAKNKTTTVEQIKTIERDENSAKLEQGKTIYSEKCIACHKLKNPSNFSKEELEKIVPKMTIMANKRDANITPEEQELILNYLLANAKQ